jgi:hypothetical protein
MLNTLRTALYDAAVVGSAAGADDFISISFSISAVRRLVRPWTTGLTIPYFKTLAARPSPAGHPRPAKTLPAEKKDPLGRAADVAMR